MTVYTPERAMKLEAMIVEANELIRSFAAVCDRKGATTNWDALNMRVRRVLADQHEYMHPERYVSPRAG